MTRRKIDHPEPCDHRALFNDLIRNGWSPAFAQAIASRATLDENVVGWTSIELVPDRKVS
jgi:hypothetical protein